MVDVYRLTQAKSSKTNLSVKTILEDRFKGLLHDQPEKLEIVLGILSNSELSAVENKDFGLQIFTANYVLAQMLYKFSGKTGIRIGTVRIALIDQVELKTWLTTIDMGVLPMFVSHDVV